MDGSGSLTKFVLGAAVASTVITLPWLYSKIQKSGGDSSNRNSLSQSTSAIPDIRNEPHQRDVLFYSGSIIPPNDASASSTPTQEASLKASAEAIEAIKKATEEEIRLRVAKAVEEERTRTQQLMEAALKHESLKFERALLEERQSNRRLLQEEIERVRKEERQSSQHQLESAMKEKNQTIDKLLRDNSEKEELIQAAKTELAKVGEQLELLEKDIQSQQLDQQENQTQREIAEVKLHEEDIKYHKALEEIKRLNEEKDAYQVKTAELQDRLTGIKEELEQAYQQIQTLTQTLDQANQAKTKVDATHVDQAATPTTTVPTTAEPKEEAAAIPEPPTPNQEQELPLQSHEEVNVPTTSIEVKPEISSTSIEDKAKSPRVIVVKRPSSIVSTPVASSRLSVAQELLKTEKSYVNQLRLIVELFIQPLEELCGKHSTCVLTKEEIESVFSDIPTIYAHNKQLAASIEDKVKDWNEETTTIGDIFAKGGTLVGYEEYCFHYANSIANYNNLLASNTNFAEFIDVCHQKPELSKLTLLDLMITPIQRMPRYALLLAEALKNTPTSHPDHPLLQEAIQKVKQQTERINDFEKTADNINKVSEVQRKLTGAKKKWTNLLTPGRRYVLEGDLTIFELGKAKQFIKQKRHFFLFSDLVLETKPVSKAKSKLVANKLLKAFDPERNERYKYKRSFAVEAIESITDTSEPSNEKWSFQVKTSVGICFEAKVDAKTPNAEQVKNEWIGALKESCSN